MSSFIPNVSPESQALSDWLAGQPEAYFASHKELSEIARGDVRSVRAGNLRTALNHELRMGRVWANVLGKGYRQLTAEEIVQEGETRLRRTHRKAYRDDRRTECASYETLSEIGKLRYTAQRLINESIKRLTDRRNGEKLARELIENNDKAPTVKDVMGLFARRK